MKRQNAPPLCRQLAEQLEAEIISGQLQKGDRVYSTPSLAQKFQVSRAVVSAAYDLLEQKGLIHREKGRGTFVSDLATKQASNFALITSYDPHNIEGYFESLSRVFLERQSLCFPLIYNKNSQLETLFSQAYFKQSFDGLMLDLHPKQYEKVVREIRSNQPSIPIVNVHRALPLNHTPEAQVTFNTKQCLELSLTRLKQQHCEQFIYLSYGEELNTEEKQAFDLLRGDPRFTPLLGKMLHLNLKDIEQELNKTQKKRIVDETEFRWGPQRATGIIGTSDHLVFLLLQKLEASQLHICDAIGRYNTLWSRVEPRVFSSIGIDFEHMWTQAHQLLTQSSTEPTHQLSPCQAHWQKPLQLHFSTPS